MAGRGRGRERNTDDETTALRVNNYHQNSYTHQNNNHQNSYRHQNHQQSNQYHASPHSVPYSYLKPTQTNIRLNSNLNLNYNNNAPPTPQGHSTHPHMHYYANRRVSVQLTADAFEQHQDNNYNHNFNNVTPTMIKKNDDTPSPTGKPDLNAVAARMQTTTRRDTAKSNFWQKSRQKKEKQRLARKRHKEQKEIEARLKKEEATRKKIIHKQEKKLKKQGQRKVSAPALEMRRVVTTVEPRPSLAVSPTMTSFALGNEGESKGAYKRMQSAPTLGSNTAISAPQRYVTSKGQGETSPASPVHSPRSVRPASPPPPRTRGRYEDRPPTHALASRAKSPERNFTVVPSAPSSVSQPSSDNSTGTPWVRVLTQRKPEGIKLAIGNATQRTELDSPRGRKNGSQGTSEDEYGEYPSGTNHAEDAASNGKGGTWFFGVAPSDNANGDLSKNRRVELANAALRKNNTTQSLGEVPRGRTDSSNKQAKLMALYELAAALDMDPEDYALATTAKNSIDSPIRHSHEESGPELEHVDSDPEGVESEQEIEENLDELESSESDDEPEDACSQEYRISSLANLAMGLNLDEIPNFVESDQFEPEQEDEQLEEDMQSSNPRNSSAVQRYSVPPEGEDWTVSAGQIIEIESRLGKGATSTVWSGVLKNRVVAIKCVRMDSFSEGLKHAQRVVQREYDIARSVNHPNIIKYYGIFYNKKAAQVNLVMELVQGISLTDLVLYCKKMSEEMSAYILLGLLEGMRHLHDNGIIHRDLKPDNVLVDSNGVVKIIDFGTATCFNSTDEMKRRSTVGTPWYCAPEVINSSEYGARCDMWSLGCLVIELVSGKPPFDDLNDIACLFKMAEGLPPPLPDGISPQCQAFLEKCLQPDSQDRPTCSELLSDPFLCVSNEVFVQLAEELKALIQEMRHVKQKHLEKERRKATLTKIHLS